MPSVLCRSEQRADSPRTDRALARVCHRIGRVRSARRPILPLDSARSRRYGVLPPCNEPSEPLRTLPSRRKSLTDYPTQREERRLPDCPLIQCRQRRTFRGRRHWPFPLRSWQKYFPALGSTGGDYRTAFLFAIARGCASQLRANIASLFSEPLARGESVRRHRSLIFRSPLRHS